MPLPFILIGIAFATTIGGVGAGVKGTFDSHKAKEIHRDSEYILRTAKSHFEEKKENTSKAIIKLGKTKLKVASSELKDFVSSYSKIKNISISEGEGFQELKKLNSSKGILADMKDTSIGALNIVSGGLTGIGTGVFIGWGTYGSIMSFGAASTGTAIGGLTGAAATNATLAWLGGGALSVGGGGMALGTSVLGGIVAGPALLIAGGIMCASARTKLNNAYSNYAEAEEIVEELKTGEAELNTIRLRANQLNTLMIKMANQFSFAINEMTKITSTKGDWKEYSLEEKHIVAIATKYAQATKMLIDVPLLTENGILTKNIKDVLHDVSLKEMTKA